MFFKGSTKSRFRLEAYVEGRGQNGLVLLLWVGLCLFDSRRFSGGRRNNFTHFIAIVVARVMIVSMVCVHLAQRIQDAAFCSHLYNQPGLMTRKFAAAFMSFRYQEITPRPNLATFINCFWWMESTNGTIITDRSLPDGCIELVFHIRNRVERTLIDTTRKLNPVVELIGQQIQPYSIHLLGQNQVLGVRFYPHTFGPFCRIPLSAFTGQLLDACTVFNIDFRRMADRVLEADNLQLAIRLLEDHFMNYLVSWTTGRKERLADYAVRWMLQPGLPDSFQELICRTGVTPRYLQQIFDQRVGVAPQMLLKILRFQHTFQYLADHSHSLTEVAYASGYYDQSHFIRDFRRFADVSPSVFRRDPAPINSYCLAETSTSYLYNFR